MECALSNINIWNKNFLWFLCITHVHIHVHAHIFVSIFWIECASSDAITSNETFSDFVNTNMKMYIHEYVYESHVLIQVHIIQHHYVTSICFQIWCIHMYTCLHHTCSYKYVLNKFFHLWLEFEKKWENYDIHININAIWSDMRAYLFTHTYM